VQLEHYKQAMQINKLNEFALLGKGERSRISRSNTRPYQKR